MSEWTYKTLGSICDVKTGNKDVNQGSEDGKYPFFTCAQKIYKIADYVFDGEAILIAGNGFFNVKYYDGKFDAYQRTYVLMSFSEHAKYVYHYIQHKLDDITSDNRGSTIRYIRKGDLTNYKIPLPPTIDEQLRIVGRLEYLLGKLSIAYGRLDKIPTLLKRFRQSVLSAVCDGRLTADWRMRKDLGEWENKPLKELCSRFQYGTSQKSDKSGFVPVLRMGNIQNGKIDWSDLVYTSDKGDIEKFALINGDVLFNRTNSAEHVGKTAIFEGDASAIFAGYLIKIHNDKTRLNSWYLNHVLNSLKAKEYCNAVKSDGVNQSNVNAQKLAAFVIPLPPLAEQEEIVHRVDKLFAIADSIEERYNAVCLQLKKAERAAYAKAFRGEL